MWVRDVSRLTCFPCWLRICNSRLNPKIYVNDQKRLQNDQKTVRNWCRIFSRPKLFLKAEPYPPIGADKLLINFFAERPVRIIHTLERKLVCLSRVCVVCGTGMTWTHSVEGVWVVYV